MSENERSRTRRPGQRAAKPQPKNNAPKVVYTPAREFNRGRLVLNIVTITAVAFAIFLGLSIFFKVEKVVVSGAEKYSDWTVQTASGIQEGDSLLFFGQASAGSKIIDALPYVQKVHFDLELPGTVHIIIEEAPVAYAVQSSDGMWWLMTAQGRITEQWGSTPSGKHTVVNGVTLKTPVVGETAVAAEPEESESSVTAADRLGVALQILQQLEASEMLGKVASVDVSNLQALQMWYGNRYQVKLGDSDRMDYKIAAVKSAIDQMSPYQTGILDASFTTFPSSVGFMQFQN
ncbi:MAG: FtsQ-type POTRA domain-containing protein [Oscillospiraceae bacterium]|nr:FtsQ-type POTRA domain-containing protein [Oscillospiraceae bacterium]